MGNIENTPQQVEFPCPKCGKETIRRTKHEREIVTKYVCPACQFEGPN